MCRFRYLMFLLLCIVAYIAVIVCVVLTIKYGYADSLFATMSNHARESALWLLFDAVLALHVVVAIIGGPAYLLSTIHEKLFPFDSIHDYKYAYTDAANCVRAKICRRCGKLGPGTSVMHSRMRVYGEDDSCNQIEVCSRCGERLASDPAWVEHVWREWEYERAASCKQMRVCGRCGDKEERTVHEWGEWQDKEKSSSLYCEQVRICRRGDGASEEREGGHDWVYDGEDDSYWPEYDKFSTFYCTKCHGHTTTPDSYSRTRWDRADLY